MWSNARSEARLDAAFPVPIEVRPVRNAKRFRLRLDDVEGVLKLTCPARTSRRAALAWALDQREWIDAQVARMLPPEPFDDGAIIPVEGEDTKLVWAPDAPRAPELAGGELRCGGPIAGFERRIEGFLKGLARERISREAAEFAAFAGVTVRGVGVGDPSSRWGSCSSQGSLRISWRLVLAAPSVRRYVVAHEVAHLQHFNHGAEFKALEARLFGDGLAEAKATLRRIGPRLRRIGRRV
jgi:predicted metal-dependent hydrolase